jgi:hypothetical protein
MVVAFNYPEDRHLVERCLAGDQEAWQVLRLRHEHMVWVAICHELGPAASNAVLRDQAFGDFWLVVCAPGHRCLRNYNPAHRPLAAYLFGVARMVARNSLRRYARKQEPVFFCALPELADGAAEDTPGLALVRLQLEEFARTRAPRRRLYLETHMFRAPTPEEKAEFSPAYGRQLQSLLLREWEAFQARQQRR